LGRRVPEKKKNRNRFSQEIWAPYSDHHEKKTEAKTSCMTAPLQVQYREIISQQFFHRWTTSYIFPILFANSICEDIEKST
jgi:hypothetical protein